MAGGRGRKPSDEAALGRESFITGAAASHAHQFPKLPCHLQRENSTHFKDTVECERLMGQHGWLGW